MSFEIKDGVLLKFTGDDRRVTIPDGVTKIGDWAFDGLSLLMEVHIPDSVTKIGFAAFKGCKSLKSADLPDSVTTIGEQAFRGCKRLADDKGFLIRRGKLFGYFGAEEQPQIPYGVTKIGDYAFYGCIKVTSLHIPDSVTEIGYWAFENCYFLRDIYIPDSVKKIGTGSFQRCKRLVSVRLPQELTELGSAMFRDCAALEALQLPEGITKICGDPIYGGVFSGCASLKEMHIPDSVTAIQYPLFFGCHSLKSVVVGKGIERLDGYHFENCTLSTLTLTGAVEEIVNPTYFEKSLGCIIAPQAPTRLFKQAKLMPQATVGFFKQRALYTNKETIAEYEKYAATQYKLLLPRLLNDDDVSVLVWYSGRGIIKKHNFESCFLKPAMEAGATLCVAFLLDWKSKNLKTDATAELKL